MATREHFSSRLGFVLIAAGCAIGLGNVWRFPFIVGQYGGAIFVLIYLAFLFVFGLPLLTIELAVGRASRRSLAQSFEILEEKGAKWHINKYWMIFGNYVLMSFYTVVTGWMLFYCIKGFTGEFGINTEAKVAAEAFGKMLASPADMLTSMLAVIAIGFGVCAMGLRKGVERITKPMMILLFCIMIFLAIRSCFLPGFSEGISYYLKPSFENFSQHSLIEVLSAAMAQAFFTLSIGIGAIQIFATYAPSEHTLASESVNIAVLDTCVALISGLIIFPACFSYGVEVGAGPSLIFITLPNVFVNMQGGRIWGCLFFLFMTFASFSTVIAVFENIMSFAIDMFGWSRNKAALVNGVIILIASMPCVLGYNVWSNLHLIGGRDVLDSEDFMVSNLLLPIGSLVYLLFCVTKWGWGFDKYIDEANTGAGLKISRKLKPYFQFILPLLILFIFIQGLI